ncbi:hypothetical protein CONLIGDRAFT_650670 [Coniochaeta ligniaria NRRL 30616]|uniref:Uncharacterized protein n=1 Tax=Coniochaeta ligniaria NRRL 30616 TaxID=1408157 RepID=A0A1J7IMD3_9PEZI|nr:hypothetical protein CONLIGDRAFT_650670 [Coniochaeta ligniaria NRRL 30616]
MAPSRASPPSSCSKPKLLQSGNSNLTKTESDAVEFSTKQVANPAANEPPRRETLEMAPHHQDPSENGTEADEADTSDEEEVEDLDSTWLPQAKLRFQAREEERRRQREQWAAHRAAKNAPPRDTPPQDAPPASQDTVMIHDDEPARSQAPELAAPISQRAPRKVTHCIYCGQGFKSKSKLLKHIYADVCKRGTSTRSSHSGKATNLSLGPSTRYSSPPGSSPYYLPPELRRDLPHELRKPDLANQSRQETQRYLHQLRHQDHQPYEPEYDNPSRQETQRPANDFPSTEPPRRSILLPRPDGFPGVRQPSWAPAPPTTTQSSGGGGGGYGGDDHTPRAGELHRRVVRLHTVFHDELRLKIHLALQLALQPGDLAPHRVAGAVSTPQAGTTKAVSTPQVGTPLAVSTPQSVGTLLAVGITPMEVKITSTTIVDDGTAFIVTHPGSQTRT